MSSRKSGIKRGAVVVMVGSHGAEGRGVVLRLKPLSAFSDAYGRQAVVQFYGPGGRVYKREMGVGDLRLIGHVKRLPKTGTVKIPHDASAIAHHERIRNTRREGQGRYYDPSAPHNLPYERPLPDWEEERVLSVHKRKR